MAPVCPSSGLFRLLSAPLQPPPPLAAQLEAKDCLGGRGVIGSRVCIGRDPVVLGIIGPFQDHQNLHVTQKWDSSVALCLSFFNRSVAFLIFHSSLHFAQIVHKLLPFFYFFTRSTRMALEEQRKEHFIIF